MQSADFSEGFLAQSANAGQSRVSPQSPVKLPNPARGNNSASNAKPNTSASPAIARPVAAASVKQGTPAVRRPLDSKVDTKSDAKPVKPEKKLVEPFAKGTQTLSAEFSAQRTTGGAGYTQNSSQIRRFVAPRKTPPAPNQVQTQNLQQKTTTGSPPTSDSSQKKPIEPVKR